MSALVLGGSSGIGAAVVRALHRDGHQVAIGFHESEEAARKLALEVDGVAVRCDVTTEAGVLAAFDGAEAALGPLEVVVHSVGAWTYTRLADLTVAELDHSWALNLRSAVLALRETARRVTEGGSVVIVSSVVVAVAPARQLSYAAAKAGLEAAVRVAAKELGSKGIRVNAVRPGATDTPGLHGSTSTKAIEAMSGAPTLKRLGQPDDIADVVAFLCRDEARWITGAILDATGGLL